MFSYVSRALCTGFPGLPASWPLGPLWPRKHRKHRTCRAFNTSALRKHRTCHTLGPWALAGACSVPQGRSNGLLEPPLGAPSALEGAARAPTRWPQSARRGCSSLHLVLPSVPRGCSGLHSVPPVCSQGLLKPARCFMCVHYGISSPCSVLQQVLELPPGSLGAREGVCKCCVKNLCSAAPERGDTALCSTLHRAWICTGSRW